MQLEPYALDHNWRNSHEEQYYGALCHTPRERLPQAKGSRTQRSICFVTTTGGTANPPEPNGSRGEPEDPASVIPDPSAEDLRARPRPTVGGKQQYGELATPRGTVCRKPREVVPGDPYAL